MVRFYIDINEKTLDSRGLDEDVEYGFSNHGMDTIYVGLLTHQHGYLIDIFSVRHSAAAIRLKNTSTT